MRNYDKVMYCNSKLLSFVFSRNNINIKVVSVFLRKCIL